MTLIRDHEPTKSTVKLRNAGINVWFCFRLHPL